MTRSPFKYPRKPYRRKSKIKALKRRLPRGAKALGGLLISGIIAAIAIGGGEGSLSHSSTKSTSAAVSHLTDKVTRVRDGDTIVVGLIPIRIANLNCAERGTKAGDRATARVKQLVEGQTLKCRLEGRRTYDREVGLCSLPGGRDLGEVLIAERLCARWR